MARSGKFYYKNEAEVMEMLGMRQVPGSGNGWVSKEDGENEHVLCQLKSTDASSIRVNKLDVDKLLINASVAHKLPVFAVQFLQSNEVFLLVRPQDLTEVSKYIESGEAQSYECFLGIDSEDVAGVSRVSHGNVVKSSDRGRKAFMEQNDKKFKRERKSAL